MIPPKVLVTGATGRTGAVVVSELLKAGLPVRALVHREDERSVALRARGVVSGKDMARILGRVFERRGAFTLGAPNDDVQQVTGRAAEPFEAVARRLATLPSNRRSAANTLREFARFLLLPFVPMPSLSRYLRRLQVTAPPRPEYTDESIVWRREHGFVLGPAAAPANASTRPFLTTR